MAPIDYHYGKFPPQTFDWEKFIPLLGPVHSSVARYDGLLTAIPNPAILLSPLTTREAVLSSRIEGTQATFGEVLEFDATSNVDRFSEDRKNDIHEILNYRKAMRQAVDLLKDLPICQRVIKEIHKTILDSVRGQNKAPGEYRKIPNWIGPVGCTIENARFIPISADKLPDGISTWEKYINSDQPDRLIQLAVLHAEFEALHPFLDGNGRIGRILIPIFMFQIGLIHSPMFYVSGYFDLHRDEYYSNLLAVSKDHDWMPWCLFFLNALKNQAEENSKKVEEILALYNQLKNELPEKSHSQYVMKALDWIFSKPIFKVIDFID